MNMIMTSIAESVIIKRLTGQITILCLLFASFAGMTEEIASQANKNKPEGPITCQLKASSNKIDYRKPIDFHVILTNQGATPREIVPSQLGKLSDPALLSLWEDQGNASEMMVDCPGRKEPTVILQPKQSVTIKVPGRLFTPGKHTIVMKYYLQMRCLDQTTTLSSNPVEIEVVDRSLNKQEAETLRKEYQNLGKQYEKAIADRDLNKPQPLIDDTNNVFHDVFVVGSPYSVPALMDLMKNSPYPYVRNRATKILAGIVGRNVPFLRDTTSFDLFLEQIAKETNEIVRSSIVFNLNSFMDTLSPQQRENCRQALRNQLQKDDGGSCFAVAFMLAKHFPQDAEFINSCLKKHSKLLPEEKAGIILEQLGKEK